MKPVTKLNLNMNPSVCEDGSLVFANNMKVDKDGCLTTDYGYKNIKALQDYNIIGHIVGLDNKVYLFTDKIKQVQKWLNDNYHTGIAVDGFYGSQTKKALVKALQTELNKQFNRNLKVDGIFRH